MIEFILGVAAGIYITALLSQFIDDNAWDKGYRAGIDWARLYWEPQVKKLQQQLIREWLK